MASTARATKLVIQGVAAPRSGSGFGLKKERRPSQDIIHGKRRGANVMRWTLALASRCLTKLIVRTRCWKQN